MTSGVNESLPYQPVVKVPRRTETGDAPVWQGMTKKHTGSIRPLEVDR